MARSRFYKTVFPILLSLVVSSCGENPFRTSDYYYGGYNGSMDCPSHVWLKDRRIFLDAGHGGYGQRDSFRVGPNGITEEAANLRVALILEEMLKKAGARVFMSRRRDVDIPVDRRADMVIKAAPEVLVSLHHNGSLRRQDGVNYSCVLVRGNRKTYPAGYDLAGYLRDEFKKLVDVPCGVISDFAVFQETGTRILRKTADVCPGVIGEPGFFSDELHSRRLMDPQFNEREAEAYFSALSRYFRGGLPLAEVYFSCSKRTAGNSSSFIKDRTPGMFLKFYGSGDHPGVKKETIRVTLDDMPVKVTGCGDDVYRVNYGGKLYPGVHRLRFSFRNLHHHSSMVMYASFTVAVEKGDYNRMIREGRRLVRGGWNVAEGLKMLQSAWSMQQTGPDASCIVRDMVTGFSKLGLHDMAEYYRDVLCSFYPGSPCVRGYNQEKGSERFPVRFHGRKTDIIFIDNTAGIK